MSQREFWLFCASLLGKNVKHHSLDKEPSILDICFKVLKSPLLHKRKKFREKNVVGLWNCIAMWALLDQVFWFPLGRKLLLLYWGASVGMPNPFPCWECGCCSLVLRANVSVFGQYFMPRQCQRKPYNDKSGGGQPYDKTWQEFHGRPASTSLYDLTRVVLFSSLGMQQ